MDLHTPNLPPSARDSGANKPSFRPPVIPVRNRKGRLLDGSVPIPIERLPVGGDEAALFKIWRKNSAKAREAQLEDCLAAWETARSLTYAEMGRLRKNL